MRVADEIGTKRSPLTPNLNSRMSAGVSVVVTLSRVSAGYADVMSTTANAAT